MPSNFVGKYAFSSETAKIIKLATIAPEGSVWVNTFHDIDKELQEKSEGRLRLKIYASGTTGDENDSIS